MPILLLLTLVLALSAPSARADAPAVPPPTAAPAGAPAGDTPTYRLGPGDVLDVAVPTHEGFNANLTVQPDGRIYYPFVGEIMVTGMTIPELTQRIQTSLEKELR